MKKQFLICALVVATINSYSQFSFGLKGGVNINNIEAVGLPSNLTNYYKSNIGFHFGLQGQLKLTEKFSISPELQFSRRGAALNNPTLPSGMKLYINYLDLPILVSYTPFKKISFDLGPNFSYELSAILRTNNSNNNANNIYTQNLDFGIASGLKFHLTNKFSIIGRYYYGITALDKLVYRDANNNQTTVTYHNSTIQFGLGYKIK